MSPDRYDSRRRGVWSHWVPLVVTLTVATAGVAAWAWSQRKEAEEENDHEPGLDYENADYGDNPPYGATTRDDRPSQPPARPHPPPGDHESYGVGTAAPSDVSGGWGTRMMSGALRRTPSPQQFLDNTGKSVAAGFAAAGAAMGKALASIREEDKGYAENPWSEEADAKAERAPSGPHKDRKTVAIVVSADSPMTEGDASGYVEHAVRLTHATKSLKKWLTICTSQSCHTFLVKMTSPRSSCSF